MTCRHVVNFTPRCSEEKTVNLFGNKLLSLCKSNGLRIVNNRHNGDKKTVTLPTAPVLLGNVLFNDALNTFYLRLYGVRHMVKDHSDSERGNPLPPHGILFSINSKGSFICTIPQTG